LLVGPELTLITAAAGTIATVRFRGLASLRCFGLFATSAAEQAALRD
jgi:hypothetical protein